MKQSTHVAYAAPPPVKKSDIAAPRPVNIVGLDKNEDIFCCWIGWKEKKVLIANNTLLVGGGKSRNALQRPGCCYVVRVSKKKKGQKVKEGYDYQFVCVGCQRCRCLLFVCWWCCVRRCSMNLRFDIRRCEQLSWIRLKFRIPNSYRKSLLYYRRKIQYTPRRAIASEPARTVATKRILFCRTDGQLIAQLCWRWRVDDVCRSFLLLEDFFYLY